MPAVLTLVRLQTLANEGRLLKVGKSKTLDLKDRTVPNGVYTQKLKNSKGEVLEFTIEVRLASGASTATVTRKS